MWIYYYYKASMFTTAHNSFYAKLKRAEMWKNIMNLKSISLGKKILNNQRLFAVWKHLSIIVLINLIKISAANKSFSLINYSNSSLLVDAWGILLSWLHKADEILNLFNVWNMCQTYMHYQHQYEHPVKPTQRDEPSLVPYSLWKKKLFESYWPTVVLSHTFSDYLMLFTNSSWWNI